MNELEKTLNWFELAVPNPTDTNKSVQLGCYLEETSEVLTAIGYTLTASMLSGVADAFKDGTEYVDFDESTKIAILDGLCDTIVTAVGVAHMFGMDIMSAMQEVNRSNFSKFVDGKPVFNEKGKIAKPDTYSPPNLNGFI